MPRRGREREHASILCIGPAENVPDRKPHHDEGDDREQREVAERLAIAGQILSSTGRNAPTSTIVAMCDSGLAIRAAIPGANCPTTRPATSGARIEVTAIHAIAEGAVRTSCPKIRAIMAAAAGTNTIDTSAAAVSSPTTYDERPPAFSCVPGKIGGTGDTASAISATLSGWLRSSANAIPTATAGMITFIARSERSSKLGRSRR